VKRPSDRVLRIFRGVEKLRKTVDNPPQTCAALVHCRRPQRHSAPVRVNRWKNSLNSYAVAPNRTDTSFDTPGSCMVTPYSTGAMLIVFLLWVMSTN
jgi:hypothetical protein